MYLLSDEFYIYNQNVIWAAVHEVGRQDAAST